MYIIYMCVQGQFGNPVVVTKHCNFCNGLQSSKMYDIPFDMTCYVNYSLDQQHIMHTSHWVMGTYTVGIPV